MKKFFTLILLSVMMTGLIAQIRPVVPAEKANLRLPAPTLNIGGDLPWAVSPNQTVASKANLDDPTILMTTYDMMTNSSVLNRLSIFPDGTIGGVATMSHDNSGSFQDRGTGYNYFDGTSWGAQPDLRLENLRTGWPSYASWNNSGEIVISHHFALYPPIMLTRPQKGTGAWTQTEIAPPQGAAGIDWPRMVTNGPGNMYVHVIGLTPPVANGGSLYQGLDGALLYNRSLDGGATWSGWQLLDGMTSTDYQGIGGDTYAFAEPRGDTLCFMVGDCWNDAFIMKSYDNGNTWTKTVIWSCPFNFWNGGDTTGTFYCPDGSNAVALDKNGKAHVLFGYLRASGDEAGSVYWFPWTDGIIYWNEDMPELPQDMDYDELVANGNYIGWVQDTMVWHQAGTSLAYYYLSMSSMPTLVIDDEYDRIYAIWSSQTTFMDANGIMYRHIFMRPCYDLGTTWGDITDLTSDFVYQFSECVYPFVAPEIFNQEYYISMMADDEAGVYVNGSQGAQGQSSITENNITILKKQIITSIPDHNELQPSMTVSQVYPNPAAGNSFITVELAKGTSLTVEIFNTTGRKVYVSEPQMFSSGTYRIPFMVEPLSAGVYFCRIKAGDQVVSRKMVVR